MHQEDFVEVHHVNCCWILVETLVAAVVHHGDHDNLVLVACKLHHDGVQVIVSDDVVAAGTSLKEKRCCRRHSLTALGIGHSHRCRDSSDCVIRTDLMEEADDDERVMEVVVLGVMGAVLPLEVAECCSLVALALAGNRANLGPYPNQWHC